MLQNGSWVAGNHWARVKNPAVLRPKRPLVTFPGSYRAKERGKTPREAEPTKKLAG